MIDGMTAQGSRILMLQGPHGPFFRHLGKMLAEAGCAVWRVGFNRGDSIFWRGPGYIAYRGRHEEWGNFFATTIEDLGITDIVLYGDTRPVHAEAIGIARSRGLRVHVFEEGYIRPYWVTYERGGANGHSRLMQMGLAQMRAALARCPGDHVAVPARWGDMREHVFYGALYHFFVMTGHRAYPFFTPHRDLTVRQEFRLYLRRLLLMPAHAVQRARASHRIRRGGFPFHLVLLQLEHDASFRSHSSFRSMTEFIEVALDGFARGAPAHHHLVFKSHPLEDGRAAIAQTIRGVANRLGIAHRVHFVRGGKLAALVAQARSAVTVNSTAAHQALWRGLPVKVFGRAVYDKPEFVSLQALSDFFAAPDRPDVTAYRDFRRYLLETSQVPGGFYSSAGRLKLLRHVVDLMLSAEDPYDALASGKAAPRQQLRVVQ